MQEVTDSYNKRDFWIRENLQYAEPNFRLRKCARLVNALTKGEAWDLLDVGCGTASLRGLLHANVNYHGIDIAIHDAAPYLRETDLVENAIAYDDRRFDIVVALGVFEYVGRHQSKKLAEISKLLSRNGRFIMSYVNFRHFRRRVWPAYNNIQSIADLTRSLEQVFRLDRCFPVYHHWRHKQPGRNALPSIQMGLTCNIPFLSSRLAGEYFFLCSPRT